MRQKYGLQIANGQDELKGRIIRIGNMGVVDELDVVPVLHAFEATLADLEIAP